MLADEAAFKVLDEATPMIKEFTGSQLIPKTSKSSSVLLDKIITIKEAIYQLRESGNIYATNVLLRSLIEYYLRLNFIMFKTMESKDDAMGESL